MRRECPDCRTVTGGGAWFCGACGYQFTPEQDRARAMATRRRITYASAVLAGLSLAVLQFMLR